MYSRERIVHRKLTRDVPHRPAIFQPPRGVKKDERKNKSLPGSYVYGTARGKFRGGNAGKALDRAVPRIRAAQVCRGNSEVDISRRLSPLETIRKMEWEKKGKRYERLI